MITFRSLPQRYSSPLTKVPPVWKGAHALLGIREAEAPDRSLAGQLKIVSKLKASRREEIRRCRAEPCLYEVNRHLNLCAALRQEYQALAAYFAERTGEKPRRKPSAARLPAFEH
jgi:hypothetical protein